MFAAVLFSGAFANAFEGPETAVKGPSIRWRSGPIRIAISTSLTSPNSSIKSDSDVTGALKRSLQKWQDISDVSFDLVTTDLQNVSPRGTSGDGVSVITIAPTVENILLFGKSPEQSSAVTRIFFDRRNQITEADIVLNPTQQFSTDFTFGTFDLETILTHEIGHLLGLEHSMMPTAMMFEDQPKNSYYGQNASLSRLLSFDDISKARALYGPGLSEPECCGLISGRILGASKKQSALFTIWAEDSRTGTVAQVTAIRPDGTFSIGGLGTGRYELFYQSNSESDGYVAGGSLGKADVDQNDVTVASRRIEQKKAAIDLQYVGINGQLSKLPVRLSAGRTYTLFVGGRNLDTKAISVGFSSPDLSVVKNSVLAQDFGKGLSVISVEVKIEPDAMPGQYSIFVESESGFRSYFAGAISVE